MVDVFSFTAVCQMFVFYLVFVSVTKCFSGFLPQPGSAMSSCLLALAQEMLYVTEVLCMML